MNKNTNLCVDLKTILQEDTMPTEGQCYRGVLTRDGEDHYLFEEEAKTSGQHLKRNPKLFDGKFINLVHMQNGRYQVHMRTIDASAAIDRRDLAFKVYNELIDCLNIID